MYGGIGRAIFQEQGKPRGLAEFQVGFAAEGLIFPAERARRIEGKILTWNFLFFLFERKSGLGRADARRGCLDTCRPTPSVCRTRR